MVPKSVPGADARKFCLSGQTGMLSICLTAIVRKTMLHIDLFSGIGGFALAAREVWVNEHEVVTFCEINKYCQQVLKKHWTDAPICEDIRRLNYEFITNANQFRYLHRGLEIKPKIRNIETQCEFKSGVRSPLLHIDLLTGGFPCQPFSNAGQKRGKDDDRYLWSEMLRVIKEFKPRWIVGENVAGIINMALDEVCTSLENEGYEVWPVVIPACAVNAPHRRDRVWIIAMHTASHGRERGSPGVEIEEGLQQGPESAGQLARGFERSYCNDTNSNIEGLERRKQLQEYSKHCSRNGEWDKNWLEVATEFCGVDDGLSVELDGFKLTKAQHRVERLKALGNAIVPQLAMEIFKAIKECDINA